MSHANNLLHFFLLSTHNFIFGCCCCLLAGDVDVVLPHFVLIHFIRNMNLIRYGWGEKLYKIDINY